MKNQTIAKSVDSPKLGGGSKTKATLANGAAVPELLTRRVDRPDGSHGHEVWCWWCEKVHSHGAGAGNRVAHCCDYDGRSPLASYDMDVIAHALASDAPSPFPRRRIFGSRRFWRSIGLSSPALRKAVVEAIFAKKPRGEVAEFKLCGARIVVAPWGWNMLDSNDEYDEGADLLSLAAILFGISPGVAAVRILEAATGAMLDARAALAIAAEVDAWRSRGAPKNDGRRA